MKDRIVLKVRALALVMGVLAFGSSIAVSQEAQPLLVHQRLAVPVNSAVATKVLTVEESRVTAVEKRDMAVVDRLLSSDFISINGQGAFRTRQEYLDGLGKSPAPRKMAHDDVRVQLYADTAIITGIGNTTRVDGTIIRSRYTHVYVKLQGEWKLAAMHNSIIVPPATESK